MLACYPALWVGFFLLFGAWLGRCYGGAPPALPRPLKALAWSAVLAGLAWRAGLPWDAAARALAWCWLGRMAGHGAAFDWGRTDALRLALARRLWSEGRLPPHAPPAPLRVLGRALTRPKILLRRLLRLPPPDPRLAHDPTGRQRETLEWVGKYQEETTGFFLRALIPSGEILGRRGPFDGLVLALTGLWLVAGLAAELAIAGLWRPALALCLLGLAKALLYWLPQRLADAGRLPRLPHLAVATEWGEALTGAAVIGGAGWLLL